MRRIWIIALAGLALVAAAVVWLLRSENRAVPPEPVSAPLATAQPQAEPALAPAPTVPIASVKQQHRSCEKNEDCGKDGLCRVVGRTPSDAPLRGCVPPGVRRAGSACDPNGGGDPAVSCGPKLVCVNGGCAPSCVPPEVDDEAVCPGLLTCVQTEAGPGCIATCKQDGCTDGKTCSFLSVENATSVCTYPDGPTVSAARVGVPRIPTASPKPTPAPSGPRSVVTRAAARTRVAPTARCAWPAA